MIVIHYCGTCGFRRPAERVAAAIECELSLSCTLRKGFWGTFRIESNGQEIYNRWKTRGWLGRLGLGRNPQPEEIVSLLRQTKHHPADRERHSDVIRTTTP